MFPDVPIDGHHRTGGGRGRREPTRHMVIVLIVELDRWVGEANSDMTHARMVLVSAGNALIRLYSHLR